LSRSFAQNAESAERGKWPEGVNLDAPFRLMLFPKLLSGSFPFSLAIIPFASP